MILDVTVRRVTLLKLLRGVDATTAERMIRQLVQLAARIGRRDGPQAPVFLSMEHTLSVCDIQTLVVPGAVERTQADGVKVLVALYQAGFFTGSTMPEPVMLSRIHHHLEEKQHAA